LREGGKEGRREGGREGGRTTGLIGGVEALFLLAEEGNIVLLARFLGLEGGREGGGEGGRGRRRCEARRSITP
jgi:hypothetical protein